MGAVRDGGDARRIDHSGPKAQKDATGKPPPEAPASHRGEDPAGLHPHAAHYEPPASRAVAQGAGHDLQDASNRRVDGLQDPDAPHLEPEGREVEGEYAPAHAVVEVVDQPGLRAGEEVAVLEGGCGEDLPEGHPVGLRGMGTHLQPDVLTGVPDLEHRDQQPEDRVGYPQVEGLRPQTVDRGEVAGEGVYQHQQGELPQVLSQPETDGGGRYIVSGHGGPPVEWSGLGPSAMGVWTPTRPRRRRTHSAIRKTPATMATGASRPPSGPKRPPVQRSGPP